MSVTHANGRFNVVAFGATPELAGDGAQLAIDPGGVTYKVTDRGPTPPTSSSSN